MSDKCFVLLLLAATFRYFGGFSLGFWSATFFKNNYPNFTNEFSVLNAVVVIFAGLPSAYIGGYLSDKLEGKNPRIKGYVSGLGALSATPFIFITFVLRLNFYIGMASYFVAYFLAEAWYGPAHAQINKIFPSEFQGIGKDDEFN